MLKIVNNQASKHTKLQISVKDTGVGIPQDKLDQIFESFVQEYASTTRKYGTLTMWRGLPIGRVAIPGAIDSKALAQKYSW